MVTAVPMATQNTSLMEEAPAALKETTAPQAPTIWCSRLEDGHEAQDARERLEGHCAPEDARAR